VANQTANPDSFVETLAAAVEGIGGHDVELLLIDYAHVALTSMPRVANSGAEPKVVSLDGSMAGRAFTSSSAVAVQRDDGWGVWVPVTERSSRIGVLAMQLPR
jgi:hypothetical protein